jgi:hypothetical protein
MNPKQTARYVRRRILRQVDLAYASLATWIPERYPDFMCIGAPRAATTWLHKRLSPHPQVFLPKRKEIHFYDEPRDDDIPDRDELRWRESFYFDVVRPAHLRWYWRQFRDAGDRLAGDITPLYSTLSQERIRQIRAQIPGLKIIYILRNPVERAWSGLRKSVWYQKGSDYLDSMSGDWLLLQVTHPDVLLRGDYPRAIVNWESVYPAGRFLYLFHDDVESDPGGVLRQVCDFLGISSPAAPAGAGRTARVNAAPASEMPAPVRESLCRHYEPQIRILEARFQRDLSHWLG